MWSQFLNLLGRSWIAMVKATGTNTLGFIVWTLAACVVGWLAILAQKWYELKTNKSPNAFRTALANSSRAGMFSFAGVFSLAIAAWVPFIMITVLSEHQSMVGKIGHLEEQLAKKDEEHCWMQNITIPAPRFMPKARSASEVVIFCNSEKKAPLFVVVDYDKEPLAAGPIAFPEARHLDASELFRGKQVFVKLGAPSILPNQIFIITVYGSSDTPPLATQIKITPIETER